MDKDEIFQTDSDKRVLVIGGGIAGLTAACALDGWGAVVHLVEKSEHLGGKSFDWACMATEECQNCGSCLSAELVEKARNLVNSKIYLKTEVSDVRHLDEKIEVQLKGNSSDVLTVDAVLLTTGFDTFDPSQITTLNYTNNKKVITTAELNTLMKKGGLTDFLDNNVSPRIAFIQCVGSRNREEGRDYCSQVCCKVALRHANKITDLIPDANISIFYIDLQIIGKEIRRQFDLISDKVTLLQGVPAEILTGFDPDKLTVIREDDQSGKRVSYHFDAVVLSIGFTPSHNIRSTYNLFKLIPDKWGFLGDHVGTLPKGIYAAGAVCGPTDILNAKQQGLKSAHEIAGKIGLFNNSASFPTVTVIGDGSYGSKIADKVLSFGYKVNYINMDKDSAIVSEGVEYFSNSNLLSVEGTIGQFLIKIDSDNVKRSIRSDVIVVAPEINRDKTIMNALEDKIKEKTIDLDELEERFKAHAEIPKKIAFWLDHITPEWKVNSRRSVKLASELAEQGKEVSIIMKNMLVHGSDGQIIYDTAREKGVKFLRLSEKTQPNISRNNQYINISVHEATLGGIKVEMECDILVIPARVNPGAKTDEIGKIVKIDLDKEGFLQDSNVRYRMISGPRKGVYFLGEGHDEIDEVNFVDEMHELEIHLEEIKGKIRPTADGTIAKIDEHQCSRCLTCFRTCPHFAIELKDYSKPYICPDACFGCGKCIAACPANAITQIDEDKKVAAKVSVNKTVIFACERSAALANSEATGLDSYSPQNDYTVITVPCAGGVSTRTIFEALLGGADRVVIAGCHEGNCRSKNGVTDARRRIQGIIRDTGISDNKITSLCIAANEPMKFISSMKGDR